MNKANEELKAIVKSLQSSGQLSIFLSCQIDAMETILEHYHPQAFRDYQYKLKDLLQEQIKLERLPNLSDDSQKSDSSSSG